MRKISWMAFVMLLVVLLMGAFLAANGRTPTSNAGRLPSGHQQPANAPGSSQIEGPLVSEPSAPQLSLPVRDLPTAEPELLLEREINPRQNPLAGLTLDFLNESTAIDPLLQISATNNGRTPVPTLTFEGVDNFCGCSPPDTIGDVGPNHYVQMVNATKFSIFDKSGTLLTGPTDLNDLWTSGGCSTSENGDPVVVYDSLADRWLLAQFSNGNGVCVAVSQTADPTGAYYGYEFITPSFPDYFKISVWPDAYYMSANESSYSALALNRVNMLAGLAAGFVRFAGEDNFLMPADVDGLTPPPADSPGLFYTFKDDATHGGADRLEIFEFDVDWVTPGNSTFTLDQNLPVTPYTYTVCGFFVFNCIPQLGTNQRVDAVSEWPMWRLAYRNFGSHETLLANFSVDVGADRAGIRWYELRRSGASWSIYQEGTHAPVDGVSRFMGSIAMDGSGNIALAYSASSASIFPSIRYATRLASDPLGTLQAEATLYAGSGAQTGSDRWGDYSALSIDPADDCTFWATNEYYPSNSGNNWNTRIGNFIMPECGGAQTDLIISKAVNADSVIVGEPLTYTLTITNNGPISATNVVVTDVLPVEVSYVSNDAGCGESGGTVTCNLGTMLDGDATAVHILVTTNATGTVTNTAAVISDTPDPNSANNSSSVTTTVSIPTADLVLSKTAVTNTVQLGDPIIYTLAITNNGPISATNVVVTDVLPVEVSYVSNDAGCGESGGMVTCNLGTMLDGDATAVHILVTTNATGTVTNTAAVTSDTPDPNSANNSSSATTTVNPPPSADLVLSKTAVTNTVQLGDLITYTLVITNSGPDTAVGVVISDTLPANVSYYSNDGGCTEAAGIVTCAVGDMVSGEIITVQLIVMAEQAGDASNTAVVTAASPADPNSANNGGTAVVTIESTETPEYLIFLPFMIKP